MNVLEATDITLRRGGLTILDGVSLAVEQGSILGVIGPNGAGKTTLFNVLTGFMKPDAGDILLDGDSILGVSPEVSCARGLARTFQKVRGFPGLTVRENVTVGALNRHRSMSDAADVASSLMEDGGLTAYADMIPSALSIGLRKRLEVARVLATEPRVVLLDEVMGGLVPSEVTATMAQIRAMPERGISVILVEHHMRAIMGVSDQVLVLDRGRTIALGTPQAIAADPEVIGAYLGKEYKHA